MTRASGLQIDGHLVLVGLPGSGKSTVGRAVANRLSRPFLDFDAELERRVGTSVARMFAEEGEVAFRQRELALTQELAAAPPMAIATAMAARKGIGAPSPKNVAAQLARWKKSLA